MPAAKPKNKPMALSPTFDEFDFAPEAVDTSPVTPAKGKGSKKSRATDSIVHFEKESEFDEKEQYAEHESQSQQPSQKDHISSYLTSPPSYGATKQSTFQIDLDDDNFEALPEQAAVVRNAVKSKTAAAAPAREQSNKSSGFDEYDFLGDEPEPPAKPSKSAKSSSKSRSTKSNELPTVIEEEQKQVDEEYEFVIAADAKRGARKGRALAKAAQQIQAVSDPFADPTEPIPVVEDIDNTVSEFDFPVPISETTSAKPAKGKKSAAKSAPKSAPKAKSKTSRATKSRAKSKKNDSDEDWCEDGKSTPHRVDEIEEEEEEHQLPDIETEVEQQHAADPFDFVDLDMQQGEEPYEDPVQQPKSKRKAAAKKPPRKTAAKAKQASSELAGHEQDEADYDIDSLMYELGGTDEEQQTTTSASSRTKTPRKSTKRGRKSMGNAESAAAAFCDAVQAELSSGSGSTAAWLHEHHSEILGAINAFSFEDSDGGVSESMEEVIGQTTMVVDSGNEVKQQAEAIIKEAVSRIDKIRALLIKKVEEQPAAYSDEFAQRAKRIKTEAEVHHHKILDLLNSKA